MQSYNLQGGNVLLPESKRRLSFVIMINFDLGFLLEEIKAGQEKIMNLLNEQALSKSEPKIYDLVQLQEILHVSKRTIATWLKHRILPHSKGINEWCSLGDTLEKAKMELKQAKDVSGLRDVLRRYPEFRKELEPLAELERKAILTVEAMNVTTDLNLK